MNKILAIKTTLGILFGLIVFHILIITGFISYAQVWAGRLRSDSEMYVFEAFSITFISLMMGVLSIKWCLEKRRRENKAVNLFLWFFAVFFLLNTLGNLFSKSIWELLFGTLVTSVLTVLCALIAREQRKFPLDATT